MSPFGQQMYHMLVRRQRGMSLARRTLASERLQRANIVEPCTIEEVLRQSQRTVFVAADVPTVFDQIPRMTTSHLTVLSFVMNQQAIRQLLIMPESHGLRVLLKDLPIAVWIRRLDRKAVSQAPEEALLREIRRVHGGGKAQQRFERSVDFLAGVQGQVLDTVFEGDGPAVEEIASKRPLPPKVVDQERSAVGAHLEGGLVNPNSPVIRQVHALDGQFS